MSLSVQDAPVAARVAGRLGLALAAAVVVFSLGVMVGKRAAESALAPAAEPRALPTADIGPATGAPSAPARPAPPPPAPPIDPERLTFYDRLSGRAPAAPVEIPAGTAPPQAAPPPPGAGAPVAVTPAAAAPAPAPSPAVAPAPAPAVAARGAAPAVAPALAPADPIARVKKLRGRGPWSVQVAAVSQRPAAAELIERYRGLGFEAVSTTVASRGKTLHRVRVGTYPSRDAATRAAAIFRDELGLPGSVPVRD